jgi:hypothetical protein
MKTSSKSLINAIATAVVVSVLSVTCIQSLADEARDSRSTPLPGELNRQPPSDDEERSGAAVSGNLYFTDEEGNRRQPTAEEVRQAAQAFQKDLARLAGKHKDDPNVQTHPSGAVSATVAVSKLAFLTVEQNEDGSLSFGHATMDEHGNIIPKSATSQPEM